jgi:hypothetical protein
MMTYDQAVDRIAEAKAHLALCVSTLRQVEEACREAGMDDDQGNVDAVERLYDVIGELEAEGISKLEE